MKIGQGVTFELPDGTKYHSYDDFGLFVTSHPVISTPEPYINLVEVIGRDSPLDYTEALDGYVHYKSRTITMSFMKLSDANEWPFEISDFVSAIHGQRLKITMDDDTEWYYSGRCKCGDASYKNHAWYITVTAQVDPYKYFKYTTIESLPIGISYPDGIDRYYKDIEVGYTDTTRRLTVNVTGFTRPVIPTFIISTEQTWGPVFSVDYGGSQTQTMSMGSSTDKEFLAEFSVKPGTNTFVLIGNYGTSEWAQGKISIRYRGVML